MGTPDNLTLRSGTGLNSFFLHLRGLLLPKAMVMSGSVLHQRVMSELVVLLCQSVMMSVVPAATKG